MPRKKAEPAKTSTNKTVAKKTTTKKLTTKDIEKSIMSFNNDSIEFQGIRTHNLNDIDIKLPKNKVITITWVSGSGKSSLAFDTIYKEGQFRYIESLSSYLRQFFNLGTRPEIDHCSGLSPAIAIEQNKKAGNSRSTVGTLTEIDDYIRLLLAKLWDAYCHSCGNTIKPQTVDSIITDLKDKYMEQKIFLLKESGKFNTSEDLTKFVKKNRNKVEKGKWFTRYLILSEGKDDVDPIEYFYLEDPNIPKDYFPIKTYGIYDRITLEEKKINRLKEDIIKILWETEKFGVFITEWKNKDEIAWFTDKMYCANCNIKYPEFTPQHFSPNRQEWACATCHGLGEVLQVDMDKTLDPYSDYLSAILPWRDSNLGQGLLKKLAEKYSMNPESKWKDLPEWYQHVVLYWDEELIRIPIGAGKYVSMYYKGIEEVIKDQHAKGLLTVDFQAMLNMQSCPDCYGAKLKQESLHMFLTMDNKKVKNELSEIMPAKGFFEDQWKKDKERPFAKPVSDKLVKINLWDIHQMTLEQLTKFIELFQQYSTKDNILVNRITKPSLDRVQTITELGLGYLSLNRTIDTLSWWEIQRLRLAKQLGNKLTGIVYVLDEPTIGLDDREIQRSIKAIRKLQEMGNTIIVVEHNEEFIKASDWIVEIGPGAGDFGGNLIFNGTYDEFLKSKALTAQYVLGKKKVNINFEHKSSNHFVSIKKASKYNLDKVDVQLQLGSFTIITGPSGAGKTTLMYETLFRFLNDKQKFVQSFIRLQLLKKGRSWQDIISAPVMQPEEYEHFENLALQEFHKELWVDTIRWHEEIKNTIYVDQTSIGKTPRSCPATFIGTFDKIRNLFAWTTDAKYLWFSAGYFSFNSNKWACPACQGYGYKKVELQFLPDTYVPCDLCKWHRYKPEILEIKWRWKKISEILEMYVDEALELFSEIDNIREELQLMVDIWLGYLKMGQPAHTLSWWESQRLKLVKHLLKSYKGHTVYFLDEPTVGLHPSDIEKLLRVLKEFLDKGDTILMIEHDKNLIKFADNIIHLDDGKLIQ